MFEPSPVAGLPRPVARALAGTPEIGAEEAAFLVLTNHEDGTPHVTLLSRAELAAVEGELMLTLAGRSTPGNMDRTGTAALFAVVDDTAYTCQLRVVDRLVEAGLVGYRLSVTGHRADSLGIPLSPVSYVTPPELPSVERWATSARLLDRLVERRHPT